MKEKKQKKGLNVLDTYENLFVRIPEKTKEDFRKKAESKGKNMSVVLRDLIENYIKED